MLINFPFVPESEEQLKFWKERAEKVGLSKEDFIKHRFDRADRYIPENLKPEYTGLEDNTGIYNATLDFHCQSVSLEDGFKIERFPEYLPVSVTENIIDAYAEEDDAYQIQESLLYRSYGWILDINHFMEMIGNQLKQSKRNFAVSFNEREYHDELFHKNGRLYHPDHSKYSLSEGDKIFSFHIFELLENDTYVMNQEDNIDFLSLLYTTESLEEAKEIADMVHDKEAVSKMLLQHKEEMQNS